MKEQESTASATGEDDATQRQRRKEKIMQSREDRLAKILSMASGRTVDPKEVHLDRTPSPTVSEAAAAGVGPVPKLSSNDSTSAVSTTSSIITHAKHNFIKLAPRREAHHTVIVLLSAIMFATWKVFVYGAKTFAGQASSTFQPWHVALAAFLGVESIEFFAGRLTPVGVLSDGGLFIFVVLLLIKLFL